jgi:hypothetical protein
VAIDWVIVSSCAAAISAVAAALSASLSLRTIRLAQTASRQQRATQALLSYIDLSLRHPDLSTEKRHERHEWYSFASLVVARELLSAYPDDQGWRNQVRQQLEYIWDDLGRWSESDIADFGRSVSSLIAEIRARRESK